MRAPTLEDVRSWPATVDVETAARALGIGRTTAYEWIKTAQFPVRVISVGRRHRVVTAGLVRLLGETETAGPAPPDPADRTNTAEAFAKGNDNGHHTRRQRRSA